MDVAGAVTTCTSSERSPAESSAIEGGTFPEPHVSRRCPVSCPPRSLHSFD